MVSGEFCEIFKNTVFYRTPLVAASAHASGTNKSPLFCHLCYVKAFRRILTFKGTGEIGSGMVDVSEKFIIITPA